MHIESKDLKSCAKKADATRIRPSSLTNQIGECDQFYQMFSPKTNIWV